MCENLSSFVIPVFCYKLCKSNSIPLTLFKVEVGIYQSVFLDASVLCFLVSAVLLHVKIVVGDSFCGMKTILTSELSGMRFSSVVNCCFWISR